jgi:hypothetical protein
LSYGCGGGNPCDSKGLTSVDEQDTRPGLQNKHLAQNNSRKNHLFKTCLPVKRFKFKIKFFKFKNQIKLNYFMFSIG